jgi:ABC-type amino acid transport system permease subunit
MRLASALSRALGAIQRPARLSRAGPDLCAADRRLPRHAGAGGRVVAGAQPDGQPAEDGRRVRPTELSRCLVRQPELEYRSDDGTCCASENRQDGRADYLAGLGRATWTTIRIATLGSLLGALLALPLAVLTARNLAAPRPLAWLAKGVLDVARSIHTLVFGLVLVGIVGLGPTAGILAIGLHSMGTYGKLFAEAIESLDMAAIDAVRSVGAGPAQVFFNAVWPAGAAAVRLQPPYISGNSISATRPSSA